MLTQLKNLAILFILLGYNIILNSPLLMASESFIELYNRLGSLPKSIKTQIQNGHLQEAIWQLDQKKRVYDAKQIRIWLHNYISSDDYVPENVKALGMGGATRPKILTFNNGIKGVFKKKTIHPSANHLSEVAAYRIDQIYGFNLVPITVAHTIKGLKGSVQYFVAKTQSALKQQGYRRSAKLNIFDYLIDNRDRNGQNILLLGRKEVAIDHGLALRGFNPLGRWLNLSNSMMKASGLYIDWIKIDRVHPQSHPNFYQGDHEIFQALSNVTLSELNEKLKPFLSGAKIKKIYDRQKKLIRFLNINYSD